jgi:four helix bundle protein
MLTFQRLRVYRDAIEFLAVSVDTLSRIPKGHARLASQLRRSAQSIAANIAEGAGRRTRADANQHYFIARGSAMESVAHLDVMLVMGLVEAERHARGVELLRGIVAMLTKMSQV